MPTARAIFPLEGGREMLWKCSGTQSDLRLRLPPVRLALPCTSTASPSDSLTRSHFVNCRHMGPPLGLKGRIVLEWFAMQTLAWLVGGLIS